MHGVVGDSDPVQAAAASLKNQINALSGKLADFNRTRSLSSSSMNESSGYKVTVDFEVPAAPGARPSIAIPDPHISSSRASSVYRGSDGIPLPATRADNLGSVNMHTSSSPGKLNSHSYNPSGYQPYVPRYIPATSVSSGGGAAYAARPQSAGPYQTPAVQNTSSVRYGSAHTTGAKLTSSTSVRGSASPTQQRYSSYVPSYIPGGVAHSAFQDYAYNGGPAGVTASTPTRRVAIVEDGITYRPSARNADVDNGVLRSPSAAAHLTDVHGSRSRGALSTRASEYNAELATKEEMRLREIIQELRRDRRRLEDKLLQGDAQGMRIVDMRDELERQINSLTKERDMLSQEAGGLQAARETAAAAEQEVHNLRSALGNEQQNVSQLQALRQEMTSKIQDMAAALEDLTRQHNHALSTTANDRDALAAKYRKLQGKHSTAEAELAAVRAELESARKEIHNRDLSLTEVKASAEVLQTAAAQVQSQLVAARRVAEDRAAELGRQVEEGRREAGLLQAQLTSLQQQMQDLQGQLKDATSRSEYLRGERERLAAGLQQEQVSVADLSRQLDAARSQAAASESKCVEVETTYRRQLDRMQKEHDSRMAAATKQFDAQLAAAERAAVAAQRQADSTKMSGEKLAEVQTSLRRERDALWQELEGLRQELSTTQHERDELASKVSLLRAEVKATMDDVRADRDGRLHAATQQHDAQIMSLRTQYDTQLAQITSDHQNLIAGLTSEMDRLKAQLNDAQRSTDKYRSTVAHLKEQLASALVSRDDLEREVAQEKAYGEELGRIVQQIKKGCRDSSLLDSLR